MSTIRRLPSSVLASLRRIRSIAAGNRAGYDRVFVVVEAHQAGLRDRRRHGMEAIESTRIGNELGSFGFEHLPDRLISEFRMAMRLRVGNTFISQTGGQL